MKQSMKESAFRFSNPILSNIKYSLHPEFDLSGLEPLSIKHEYDTNIHRDLDEPRAVVELVVSIGDKDPKLSPFFIELTMSALFFWPESYSDEIITTLLSVNAPAVLLSYARPIVASITSMSPYPSYNIPFCNFAD